MQGIYVEDGNKPKLENIISDNENLYETMGQLIIIPTTCPWVAGGIRMERDWKNQT